jgi:hypothetical protein
MRPWRPFLDLGLSQRKAGRPFVVVVDSLWRL